MNTSPLSGSDPNTPAPPQQPGDPTPQPDRGAGFALAGFLCGLASFAASVVGSAFFITGAFGGPRILAPDLSLDERLFEIVFALAVGFPVAVVALVGAFLSYLGRNSTSRRWMAVRGMALCALTMVPFLVLLVLFFKFLLFCSTNCNVVP